MPLHPYFRGVVDYFDICPFQLSPNGYKELFALYILYKFKSWGEPSPHEVNYLFNLKSNPSHSGTCLFYLTHQETGHVFLSDVTYKSNVGKYQQKYFLTADMAANNLAFNKVGKNFSNSSLILSGCYLHLGIFTHKLLFFFVCRTLPQARAHPRNCGASRPSR